MLKLVFSVKPPELSGVNEALTPVAPVGAGVIACRAFVSIPPSVMTVLCWVLFSVLSDRA